MMYNSASAQSPSTFGTGPVENESPSRIRDGITHCEESLSAIHEAINGLEKRLDTALQPLPPSVTQNDMGKPSNPGSHLHGRLTILNDGFTSAVQRLRELTRRIEV